MRSTLPAENNSRIPSPVRSAVRAARLVTNFSLQPAALCGRGLVRSLALLAVGALGLVGTVTPAQAQAIVYWDADGTSPVSGGAGNWNTSSLFWSSALTSGTYQAWTNSTTSALAAQFEGTGGAVNVATGINVYSLTFRNVTGSYSITGSSTLTLSPSAGGAATQPTIDVGPFNVTISAPIAGANGLVKTGTGILTLNNTETYTGTTTVTNGTLTLGASGSLATTSTLAIYNSSTFDINSRSQTLAGISIADGNITGTTGTLTTSGTISVTGTGNSSISAIIGGTGGIAKSGTGTLTLSGNNTYTGTTTITDGTLKLGATGNATNTPLGTTGAGTTVSGTGSLDLNGFTLGTTEALSLTGTGYNSQGALTNSTGSATYSGAITLTGATTIAGAGNITLTNATLSATNQNLTLGGTAANSSISSNIAIGSGTVTKTGTGTWTLSGNSTYTGLTTISGGTLKLGTAGTGGNTPLGTVAAGTVVSSGGALDLNGITLSTTEALTLNGTGPLTATGSLLNTGALVNNSGSTAATYSGAVTLGTTPSIGGVGNITLSGVVSGGTNTLTKVGTNTLFLTNGSNTYTGATTVNGGTLALSGAGTTQSSSIVVSGGTFVEGDATTSVVNRIVNTSSLTLGGANGGGTFQLMRGPAAGGNQTLTRLTVGTGVSTISGTGSGGGVPFLALSNGTTPYVRNAGGILNISNSGVNVQLPNLTTGAGNVAGTGVDAILVGAVLNGTDFIRGNVTGNVTASTGANGYTNTGTSTWTAGKNMLVNSNSVSATGANVNSVIVQSGARTLTLSGTSNIASGMVLIGSGVNANNTTITGGNISGPSNSDLILINNSTGILNVASAIVNNGTSSVTLSGNTTGSISLSGTNTYTGNTNVLSGTVNLGNSQALGGSAAGTTTGALNIYGGTLNLNNNGYTVGDLTGAAGGTVTNTGTTVIGLTAGTASNTAYAGIIAGNISFTKAGAGNLTLSGTNTYLGTTTINGGTLTLGADNVLPSTAVAVGSTGAGILDVNTRTDTVGAVTVVTGGSSITGTTGTLTGSSYAISNSSGNVTLSANLGGDVNATLTKSNAGTLIISGNNTYGGNISVTGGLVEVQSNNAFGSSSFANSRGNITFANGTQLNLNGSNLVVGTALPNGNASFNVNVAGTGTGGQGVIFNNSPASSTAQLAGNITLTGNSTFNSGTAANSTLVLGLLGVVNLTYSPGSIVNTSTIDLGTNTLTFNGSASTTTQVNGAIVGTGGSVVVNTSGIVNYNAQENTYTGNTTIQNGTLTLSTTQNPGAPHDATFNHYYGITGNILIGDGAGTAGTAVLTVLDGFNEAIKDTSNITINTDGVFNVSGASQTIGKLAMTGGTINTVNGGVLYLSAANSSDSVVITPSATSGPSTINGTLSLTLHRDAGNVTEAGLAVDRIFTVNQTPTGNLNAATGDLIINANIQQGGLVKNGTGTLTLATSHSDYAGNTTINAGILRATVGTDTNVGNTTYNKSSLGLSGGANEGTIVNSGGTLQLSGTISITNEELTLKGTGADSTHGALDNLSGNNTWGHDQFSGSSQGRLITLDGNATISSTAGLLTIAGGLNSTSGSEYALTVNGSGNTTIVGSINTQLAGAGNGTLASSVTKTGSGTLTLSGASTYAGNTNVQAGVLVVNNNTALGNTTAGTFVTAGAEIQLPATGGIVIAGEPLQLAGSGVGSTTGALRNMGGNNTWGGVATIGTGGATIYSGAGTLTLDGTINTAGNALTVAGAGNFTQTTGSILNGGDVTKTGTGTAIFGGSSASGVGNITLSGGNATFSNTLGVTATGNVSVNPTAGTLSFNGGNATVQKVHLLTGNISVGSGTTLFTQEFDSTVGSTLAIAGTVDSTFNSGTTTTFSGNITGSGTFKLGGSGTVIFDQTINDGSLTVYIGGTSTGTMASPLTVKLNGSSSVHLTFGDIYLTGDTILDFGNSTANFLSSTNLYIYPSVKISVTNWASMSDEWYVSNSFKQVDPITHVPIVSSTLNQTGTTPENQITFIDFAGTYTNNNTAWISPAVYPTFFDHEIRPVPEPSTYGAIFLSGCLGLIAYRRYRAKSK